MTYDQTIDYLFTRLPMFSRIGAAAFRKDLTNTIALCKFLGNPQNKFKSIHIGGTNGKGSTSHMIASVLQTAGYKTGLYTSPHLKDFRERIKINGAWIPENFVVDFVQRVESQIELLDPSFFEITVAMAFDFFARTSVDVAVIEVGLGGRLDSTNIILPELSIITNIGYDHMNLLGHSLEEIAWEKAGIIKKKVPVIIGEIKQETQEVFKNKAKELDAPIEFADQVRRLTGWKFERRELLAEITTLHTDIKQVYRLDLAAIYQAKNLITALEAFHLLQSRQWNLSEEHIHQGLAMVRKSTGLHGRWELIHQDPMVVLDVGHNEDGIRQIVRQIELTDYEELHIVIGLVKDKEIDKMLTLLPKHAFYYFTKAQIPRALPEVQLIEKALKAGLNGKAYPKMNDALQAAMGHAHPRDLIVVCGSVFVVGEVNLQKTHS
ncbi:MAG: bifunctional folylpolyglutamate synthase/dihydrofolate synthase [Chitinophagales bacterium]